MKFNLYGLLDELSPAEGANGGGGSSSSNDEGGNSEHDSNNNSSRDAEINDDELKGDDNEGSNDSKDDDGLEDIKKELEDLREDKKNRDRENTINSVFDGLKKDYPDIDRSKVENKLKEIAKENPEEAKRLNNPAGFELLHIKYFQTKDPGNDDFNPGRGTKENFDFDDSLSKAKSGDTDALKALYRNSKSTNV